MSDLRFVSVELEDFKNFPEAKLKLDRKPGLYFISGVNKLAPELGANGAGKSTLFDAILWCLFGRTGRDSRPGAAVGPWGKKTLTRVHLKFERGDQQYEIVRCRNPNSLEWYKEDGPYEIQQEEIPKLLGMSEETFRRTMILGQFGTLFLDLSPEQKSQMFTEALSLDVWMDAALEAARHVKDYEYEKNDLSRKQAAIEGVLARIKTDVDRTKELEAKWDDSTIDELAELADKIDEAKAIKVKAEKTAKKKPVRPDNSALQALDKQIAANHQSVAVLKRDMEASLKDILGVQGELKRMAEQAKNKKKTCLSCGQPITDTKFIEKFSELENEVNSSTTVADNQDSEIKGLIKIASDLTKKRKDVFEEFTAADSKYVTEFAAWKSSDDLIAVATQRVSDLEDRLNKAKNTINPHTITLTRLKKDLKAATDDLAGVTEGLGEVDKQVQVMKLWSEAFKKIRLSIIDEVLVELEMATVRHMGQLGLEDWLVKFETEKETQSGKVNYSFTVLLFPPGQDDAVKWESYSGGESQRIQLAVAFGLSEVLLSRAGLQPNIEVLDEPTRGLSSVGVGDLLEHLRDRALELGRSIYFVDHHSLDKGDFDGTLVVTKTKNGSDLQWL